MTVRINSTSISEVPEGVPLARVTEDGIWLWPQGVGQGPCILMAEADWYRMRDSVEAALTVKRNDWSAYLAVEGDGRGL